MKLRSPFEFDGLWALFQVSAGGGTERSETILEMDPSKCDGGAFLRPLS